jgi:hypothetical protein
LRACGASPDFVNFLANRGHIPKADKFIPLADFFGVSVDYLLGHEMKVAKARDPEYGKVLDIAKTAFAKLGISDETIGDDEKGLFSEYIESHMAAYLRLKSLK